MSLVLSLAQVPCTESQCARPKKSQHGKDIVHSLFHAIALRPVRMSHVFRKNQGGSRPCFLCIRQILPSNNHARSGHLFVPAQKAFYRHDFH
jgi:hypothetical protein